MNAENAQKLARRFIELPSEKRRLFLEGLCEEGVDFSLFPIPANVACEERDGLSYAQQRMWFLWQLDPQSAAYNLPMAVRLKGELDRAALQHAFDGLVARHETLRSRFSEQDGLARQHIVEPFAVAIAQHDLSAVEASEREDQVRILADDEALAPFDLTRGPLLRVHLLKLAAQEHVLLLTLHHIVADGWSYNVLIDEFIQFYDAASSATEAALQPLPIQYRDYALWQRSWLEAGEQDRQLVYWRDKLGGEHVPLELPTDHPRPLTPSYRGARHEFEVEPVLAERLRILSREQGVTLFMVLLAAFKVLLYRYSGQSAIRVGVPVANRNRAEVEGLIGCFINTQVLHTEIDPLIDVRELLQRVKETALGAQAHQDLPFERLVEALDLDRSLSHSPLFQVLFNHQSHVADTSVIKGQSSLTLAALQRESRIAQFDLTLDTYEQGGHLYAAFGYATDLFDEPTIERMAGHWRNLLEGIVQYPQRSISELPLLSSEEHRQIVYHWNRTEANYPRDQCIHALIEEQAAKTPDSIAVLFGDQELTYRQLNQRANQLARKLRELGVGPEVLVGIAVERSLEIVIGLLAILKTGGAYVPLDPEYPQQRLAYMLEDSQALLLLSQSSLLPRLPQDTSADILLLDQLKLESYSSENTAATVTPEGLAYSIYTSGSTGRPKGVLIEHRNVAALIGWAHTVYSRESFQGVLASTSICFDLSVWELFVTLAAGGYVVLANNALELPLLAAKERVHLINTVPSAIKTLYETGQLPETVHTINLAGEPLKQSLVDDLYRSAHVQKVYDLYGPSEDTTYSTYTLREKDGQANIGRPISNSAVYLIDESVHPVPIGSAGELCLSGAGLTRGYLRRPALTAEKFLPNPFDESEQGGGRLYRTGDLARYRPDGVIEYVGRIDHQVKVRGFRIELGEIEAKLQEHAAVREAVVIDIDGPGGKQLAAYLVLATGQSAEPDQQNILLITLREHLKAVLPDYMVPTHLLFLDALPLTPNGKLDRKALPKPDTNLLQKAYVAPHSELEQHIADIWADVLGIERVGLSDNFFALGGHSLLATRVISRIRQTLDIELPLRSLFEAVDLSGFVAQAGKNKRSKRSAFEKADRSQPLALSYAQQRQWFLWQLEPQGAAYNIPAALRLKGTLDIGALHHGFESLIVRHETLRTTFRQEGDQAIQIIHPSIAFALEVETVSQASEENILVWVEAEANQPFDLVQGPLLRVRLLRLAENDHVLLLTLHHIVSDGWSMPVMVDELVQLYEGYSTGREVKLPELPAQYADYAIWQRQWMAAGEQERQLAYWKAQLGDEQPVLELPTDHPRPAMQSYSGSSLNIGLDSDQVRSLRQLAQQQGVTLFMLLLASFQTLLHRYSGQCDIRVGVPIANRTRAETERLIGFFVNTQVLKAEFDLGTTFRELLQQVKHTALEAQAHQDLPFEKLVEALQPERSLSHSPLFQVMFNHQAQVRGEGHTLPGLKVESLVWDRHAAQFDLTLDTFESEGGLRAALTYATDLFEHDTVERLAAHWKNLLSAIIQNPQQRISELPLLSEEEYQRTVHGWNSTRASYPSDRCIHQLIEAQSEKTPHSVAVIFGDQELTYQQLNQRSNQLAHKLGELGVGPDVLVGIAVERSPEMVVGLLAILKAGGAYVPLDPEYPQERLNYMLEDSGAILLLSQSALQARLPLETRASTLMLDQLSLEGYPSDNPVCLASPENLAYSIYTSGSTGRPKGVLIEHRNAAALIGWARMLYSREELQGVLASTSICFDLSVWELFVTLSAGGYVVLASNALELPLLVAKERVRLVNTVPSVIQALCEAGQLPDTVRTINLAGEALKQSLVDELYRAGHVQQVYDLYGPSEDTTYSTCTLRVENGRANIGRPISNGTAYLLDGSGLPVAIGCVAELCLAGAGLARGYLGRPALTAEKFLPNPYDGSEEGGGRLYRTGDLARYRADGVIEYAGRIDHQVKVRGFRIELGEVEARLLEQEAVLEAVVLAQEALGGQQLVGHIVPSAGEVLEDLDAQSTLRDRIKEQLKASLPDYMVPAYLLFLREMPLTPNGKLDRKALPMPDISLLQQKYVAPRSELQQSIAAIWAEVLKVEQVGLTDNFFELGGDSIISIQVVSRARQAGISFTAKDLFQRQTVLELAVVARMFVGQQIDQGPVTGEMPLTPIQRSFFEVEVPERYHWNQSVLLKPAERLVPERLGAALNVLVEHHDALRLRFTEKERNWTARFEGKSDGELLWQRDLSDIGGLEVLCNEAQASLSLEQGPLLRALLVNLPKGQQRLLLVIHHLVVDGISWRIVLEDLQTAYQQLSQGRGPELPSKTSSLQTWAEHLIALAASPMLEQELAYWQNQLQDCSDDLPCDHPDGGRQYRHAVAVSSHLDRDWTRRLLQDAPAAYRTQVNDLLLTALARVICHWTGQPSALIRLEGHGREDLFEGLDTTRTLGWFTSMYPLRLALARDEASSLKTVKEQLRAVPNKGLGYGLLRHLGKETVRQALQRLPRGEIVFNYLGQFDQSFDVRAGLFMPADESGGRSQSGEAPLDGLLSINGQVYGGELSLGWTFSREVFDEETVQRLADEYTEELKALIEHCTAQGSAGLTPSDFPLAGLDQAQLDALPISARDIEDIYPLSPMQQGMLFHTLYAQGGGDYINQMRVDVDGLDVERFRQAWQSVVDRHDVLRARFVTQFEQPLQVIRRQVEIPFASLDWSAQLDIQQSLDTWAEADRQQGFDLLNDPLLRLAVIRTGENSHHLIYTSHHILMDGWSSSQLLGEVLQVYAGQPGTRQPSRYRDYIDWLQKQDKASSEAFWKEQLKDLDGPTRLAQAIRQDKVDLGTGYGDHYQVLDQQQTQRLIDFARQQRVTVNTLVQAAWLLLLQRYTGQDSVTFGATVAGRPGELQGVEQQLGLFINTLSVIASPKQEQSVAQWIEQVQAQNLALREHEHTPLYEIQRWAGFGGESLFDNILVFENYPISEALQQGAPDGLSFSAVVNHEQTNYPLTLGIGLGEELSIHYSYDREHFSAESVARLGQHFGKLLDAITQQPQQALGELRLLDEQEYQRIVHEWNRTQADYPSDRCIHELIEDQVRRTPQAVAVVFEDLQLTYEQLDKKANRLAYKLIELGVCTDVLVGIAVERSPEMVIGLLAILKAGGAYVPLDPEYPRERLAYMIEDSGIGLLLIQEHLREHLPVPESVRCLGLDQAADWLEGYGEDDPARQSTCDSAAYVIFTSGSTGKPKGVTIPHGAFAMHCQAAAQRYGITGKDCMLQFASISFDAAAEQIFMSLAFGLRLVMGEVKQWSAEQLLERIKEHGVSILNVPPAYLAQVVESQDRAQIIDVRLCILGGEAWGQGVLTGAIRAPHLFNAYGPTEAVVTPMLWEADSEVFDGYAPIGRPVGRRCAYVLDEGLSPLPLSVSGELHLGGEGLGRGYHERPALTAERFIPDPFDSSEQGGGRLYRTGDLTRYRTGGVIEYAGRIDHQVKIRGFRIELGEIEAQLQAHEAVREAVVIDIEEAIGKQLAAYLVTDTDLSNDPDWQATLRSTLRDYLKESLPDYMVPAHLVFLEAMPLTPNGKLDRKALPKPDASQLQQEYVAPRSELEQRIASIWAEVLKVEQVGLSDNFFELGGHSLLATQVISRLRQALDIELPLRTLFETRDLADFARQVGQGKAVQVPALVRMDRSQPLVLSYAQQRQWFLWQLEPESSAYHLPTVVSLKGALDIEALQRSFESLIQRHESLRTTFRQEGEQAIQVVHPRMAFTLAQERLEAADEVLIRTKVEAEVDRPFDLEPGPLLRVKLLRLSEDEHMLILTLHHIVSDGWSSPIMVDELVRFYEGYSQGREVELPELPIQYADYAIWQRSWMEAGEQERQLAYWKAQLGDEQPVLELPTDRTRPAILSQEGAGLSIELNNELAQSLKQLAQQQGVTLFMLLLASFQALLHRYSGQNDIRVGVPIANRNCVETERLIGFFVNTQVLKAEFELQMSFSELLRQVKRTALEAQAHQDLPFEQLVEALQPERSLSHSPLFQVMYNHQAQVKGGSRVLPGLKLASLEWSSHTSHFDLTLDTFEHEAGIGASLNYATALFDEQTIARLARHWLNLLQGIVKTPSQRIAELPMLAEVERRAILEQWDNTHAIYPSSPYVHQLIEEQVRQTPNAVAVIFNDQPLTYRELDAQANRLAHKLIEMGVGPEVRVAIAMRRSAEIMVAFLAVLKAGGAYVPLDVAHPRERLLYMMEDCKATLVLTQSDLLDVLAIPQGLAAVLVDKGDAWSGYPNSAPVVAIAEDNLAYVIYTSGSTGQPKGVAVSHGPLVAHIQAIADLYETGPADCELHFMSFAFDGSHEGWMPALAKGARVLIRDDSLWLPEYTYAQMHQHNVTIGIFPPVYLQQLAEHAAREGNPPTTRIYCFGGDAVPQASYELARKALRPDYIVNGYGPTETVVTPLLWKAGKSEHCGAAYAPIGRLVGRRRGYVLGSDLSLLPAGFTGELYLGGHGVARGYLDRPGFTAERFVPDPFGDGERVYRSGDLTRTRADGIVDYLGRIDYQVKIRGFRIELGEIEARLQDHEAVRESVVIDIEGPSGKQLAAYLVTDTDLSNDREQQATLRTVLRDYLKESLPDYMVPAHLVFLDKLPLTPNGKLDRKALPEPDASQLQQEYVAPQSELEQRIAAIWADVLKVERVGLTDNFFELGGDSIISIQVVSRARQIGIGFTPKELFQHQTVQGLASVAKRGGEGGLRIDQGPVTGEALLLPIHQSFFEEDIPQRHHWNQALLLKPGRALNAEYLEQAIQALVVHHDALRLSFIQDANQVWTAHYRPVSEQQPILWQSSVQNEAQLEALCTEAQGSLNLQDGPLIRAVLASLADGSQRLLLAIHHLVVDGVSWRILMEDLQTAYGQLTSAQAIKLPAKTSSTKAWAEHLQTYANSEVLQQELGYWKDQLADANADLPCDNSAGSLQGLYAASVHTHLDQAYTRQLLQQAPAAYRTQVNDLLLTALARVIARWTQQDGVLIQLEGHGREDLFEDIDLSRTLGWFTSVFPVKLSPQAELPTSIKTIKEQLRAVPNKGIGFGALRYLGGETAKRALSDLPEPRITFNYLGQFDGSFGEGENTSAFLIPAVESSGASQSAQTPLGNWLSINGQVYGGELRLDWSFSQEMYKEETIQRLAQEYAEELEALIAHCAAKNTFGLTPSDVPLAGLSQPQLEVLPIPAQDIEDIYPLSPMQQGMLFHTLYAQGDGDYINQMRVDVEGLDVECFRQAWQAVVNRHDALRASFITQFEQPLQVIRKQVEIPFVSLDWRTQPDLEASLDTWAEADRQQGFDLLNDPLLRLAVIRTGENSHQLVYTSHHILMDGWSNSQSLGEVLQAYAGVQANPQAGRYRDYIEWLQKQDKGQDEAFWRNQFGELQEPTRLAQAIRQDKADLGTGYGEHYQVLGQSQTRLLSEFARQQRVTVNTLVQATWLLLLQRYTGQDGVTFGATVAGRPAELKGVEQQLGLFINTLPVIASPKPEQSVAQWLEQVQAQNLALREHEHTPLYEVQRWAGFGGEALFDNILVFENYPISDALQQGAPDGLKFGAVASQEQTNYPLTLAIGLGNELSIHYSYDHEHFSTATVQKIAEHFGNLFEALTQQPQQLLGELPLLSKEEQQQIIHDWNRTEASYPSDQCIRQLIEIQADRTPDAVAVIFGDQELTYRELNRKANQLAYKLQALGVGPDVLVGIAMERSLEMVVGLLAILKAGGAYVPLDPEYPRERLAYMIEDSGIQLLLSQGHLQNQLPVPSHVQRLDLDQGNDWQGYSEANPANFTQPENLAYVIYTSGSTGRPKGAANSHAGLVNRLNWMQKAYELGAVDTVLQKTPFSFDVSVWEFFWPLITGARLAVAQPGDHRDPARLIETIHRHKVTTLHFVPSMLQAFMTNEQVESCTSIKRIVCSGEALPADLVQQTLARLPEVGLFNLYGPTEAAIDVTHWTCRPEDQSSIPIGQPIDNLKTHILTGSLSPVGQHVGRELYLGGVGLARGYHQRPALTAERFIPDPFDNSEQGGGRLYRTGDLARYRADGVIEYAGRIDHQVKIRGFRIELGEIETRLQEHEAIREAVVIDIEGPSGKQLAAYLVTDTDLADDPERQAALRGTLREHLKVSLPDYMVPAHLVFLETLPLTPNGKLDRKALPKPDTSQLQQKYVAPRSELEQQVASIWADVLKVEKVGLTDNFFELGGHSLLAVQVISQVNAQLGIDLPLQLIFESPSLSDFSMNLKNYGLVLSEAGLSDIEKLMNEMAEA